MKVIQAKAEILGKEQVKQSANIMGNMMVHFIVDRDVSYELIKYLLGSYVKESIPSSSPITVVEPYFFRDISDKRKSEIYAYLDGICEYPRTLTGHEKIFLEWCWACTVAEASYFTMLEEGATPEEARVVLPNSLKTEVLFAENVLGWRQIFKLITKKKGEVSPANS